MSVHVCDYHRANKRRLRWCRICACLVVILIIISITTFLIWAILRPKKPNFFLQDPTLFTFNMSSNANLTSRIQVTVTSRNPNDKIGIYYDYLRIYATYNDQQITIPLAISPIYQGHHAVNTWSRQLSGINVPVASFNLISLSADQSRGYIILVIKIEGRIRWKVGTYISGKYFLYVKCEAFLSRGSKENATFGENVVPNQMLRSCSVSM